MAKRRPDDAGHNLGQRLFEREATNLEEWARTLEELADLDDDEIVALIEANRRRWPDDSDA